MSRLTWDQYFIEMAITATLRRTCMRRSVGAVLVKDNQIISTGYNGSPSGYPNCVDQMECIRVTKGIPSGERLDLCIAVHAEINALDQALRRGLPTIGTTLYCTTLPCERCARTIIRLGVSRVVYIGHYPGTNSLALFKVAGIQTECIERGEMPYETDRYAKQMYNIDQPER